MCSTPGGGGRDPGTPRRPRGIAHTNLQEQRRFRGRCERRVGPAEIVAGLLDGDFGDVAFELAVERPNPAGEISQGDDRRRQHVIEREGVCGQFRGISVERHFRRTAQFDQALLLLAQRRPPAVDQGGLELRDTGFVRGIAMPRLLQ